MIVGDFNAHLADAGNSSVPNSQGVALRNLIDRNCLYVASLDKVASGPGYTYCSGVVKTTVDYILHNQCASYLVISSEVLKDHPLNTSDRLALCKTLEVNTVKVWDDVPRTPRINWNKAVQDSNIEQYQSALNGMIRPLLENSYDSIKQVEQEIELITVGMSKLALQLLPLNKEKRTSRRRFKDAELQSLCSESKQTWSKWADAGRPTSGDLYEKKKENAEEGSSLLH